MEELTGILKQLRAAVSAEDYEQATRLLQEYCQNLDGLLTAGASDNRELIASALAALPALVTQLRAARSHHARQLSLIRASKHYLPDTELASATNFVG